MNGRVPLGTTPLIVAASQAVSRSMVELLLEAGAQVRATSDLAVTALAATERIAAATQTEGHSPSSISWGGTVQGAIPSFMRRCWRLFGCFGKLTTHNRSAKKL